MALEGPKVKASVETMAYYNMIALMDLRIGAARKLALAISRWFGGAKASSVTDGQLTTCHNVFPQSVDVIPGRLNFLLVVCDRRARGAKAERDYLHLAPRPGPET